MNLFCCCRVVQRLGGVGLVWLCYDWLCGTLLSGLACVSPLEAVAHQGLVVFW